MGTHWKPEGQGVLIMLDEMHVGIEVVATPEVAAVDCVLPDVDWQVPIVTV